MRIVTRFALTAGLFTALLAAAAVPSPAGTMEDLKKGKEAFDAECMKCHDTIEEAAGGKRQRGTWEEIVNDMVPRGANLEGDRKTAVVEYLSTRSIFVTKCGVCHSIQRTLAVSKTYDEWKATSERMAGKFKDHLTAEDIELIAAYLTVERPAK